MEYDMDLQNISKQRELILLMTQLSHHRGKFFSAYILTWRKKVLDLLKRNISDVLSTSLNSLHNRHHLSIAVPDGQATSADDQATSNDFINGPPTFIEVTDDPPTFAGFTGSGRTSAGFAGGQHTSGKFTGGQRTSAWFKIDSSHQLSSLVVNRYQLSSSVVSRHQPC